MVTKKKRTTVHHASAFSGIGGFDLAAQWMGWKNLFQVEIDEYCRQVLAKNFPDTQRYGDIRAFDGSEYRGQVDVLTAGFPCQPFSVAGKRTGKTDERYLWDEAIRLVRTIEPQYVVGENVPGIIGLAFDKVCTDLEMEGYQVQPFLIPACAVNAPHQRDRVWFIAYTHRAGCQEQWFAKPEEKKVTGPQCHSGWQTESGICRVVDGIPSRVDRVKGLGNAIVPQVAFEIFQIIEQFHRASSPE